MSAKKSSKKNLKKAKKNLNKAKKSLKKASKELKAQDVKKTTRRIFKRRTRGALKVRLGHARPVRYLKYIQSLWMENKTFEHSYHTGLYLAHLMKLGDANLFKHVSTIVPFCQRRGVAGVDGIILSAATLAQKRGNAAVLGEIFALLDSELDVSSKNDMFIHVIDMGSTGQQALLTVPDSIRTSYGEPGMFGSSLMSDVFGAIKDVSEVVSDDMLADETLMATNNELCQGAVTVFYTGLGNTLVPGAGAAGGYLVGEWVSDVVCGYVFPEDEGGAPPEETPSDTTPEEGEEPSDEPSEPEDEDNVMPNPDGWEDIVLEGDSKSMFELFHEKTSLIINNGQEESLPPRNYSLNVIFDRSELILVNPDFEIEEDFNPQGPNPIDPRPDPSDF